MLPKAHLTSHSRMSDSRWVTTLLWLSGSLRPFLYSSSLHSRHLFSISSASVWSLPFLSFIVPMFAWNVPLVSPIYLRRSLVLIILLLSSTFLHCSLRKLSYFSLLFSGTLLSNGYILSFVQWQYRSQWGLSKARLLLIENFSQMGVSFLFSFAFCFSSFSNL